VFTQVQQEARVSQIPSMKGLDNELEEQATWHDTSGGSSNNRSVVKQGGS